jgi:hypothetical protein
MAVLTLTWKKTRSTDDHLGRELRHQRPQLGVQDQEPLGQRCPGSVSITPAAWAAARCRPRPGRPGRSHSARAPGRSPIRTCVRSVAAPRHVRADLSEATARLPSPDLGSTSGCVDAAGKSKSTDQRHSALEGYPSNGQDRRQCRRWSGRPGRHRGRRSPRAGGGPAWRPPRRARHQWWARGQVDGLGCDAGVVEGLAHRLEVGRGTGDDPGSPLSREVLRAPLHGDLHDLVLVVVEGDATMPLRSNCQPTAPGSAMLPPLRLKRLRISAPVRLRLSLSVSTMTATPPGP